MDSSISSVIGHDVTILGEKELGFRIGTVDINIDNTVSMKSLTIK